MSGAGISEGPPQAGLGMWKKDEQRTTSSSFFIQSWTLCCSLLTEMAVETADKTEMGLAVSAPASQNGIGNIVNHNHVVTM